MRSVVIHGHYYQPPRENPWTELVEEERTAAPDHDWNQRITRECYRAVAAARLPGPSGRLTRIVNTLAWTSFNFGPTLLDWLEREALATYHAILEADRLSLSRLGHGNALAQPYHHVILPLASRRDKVTEVRWGILDFRRRFGRDPEGMWLPETAVDGETLEVLIAEGIRFTVLAPHQVKAAPARGFPGAWPGTGGRRILLFPYDGAISSGVAFGPLIQDGRAWAERLLAPAAPAAGPGDEGDSLVVVATDGETYGHHHRFGEMALARAIAEVSRRPGARIENFASFLARDPPIAVVELVAPSSWSCTHGVERWRADCGCRVAPERPTSQTWRAPLRDGLTALATALHQAYEREAAPLLGDPWAVRDDYGAVVGSPGDGIAAFVAARIAPGASETDRVRARELLELERDSLRLFTSCAWFFDDISGLEPLQVLRYAARAIRLAGAAGTAAEPALLARLGEARSNDLSIGTARDIYLEKARPLADAAIRTAAGFAAASHFAAAVPRDGGAYAIELRGRDLTLGHRRTGRVHHYTADIVWHGGRHLTVEVHDPEAHAGTIFRLEDLPERVRTAVSHGIRRTLLERAIEPAELTRFATSAEPLGSLLERTLVQAVAALAQDRSPGAFARVRDLLGLHQVLDLPVPFDAQTEFYRVCSSLLGNEREAVAALSEAMGFEGF
jgi:hypothetical protein